MKLRKIVGVTLCFLMIGFPVFAGGRGEARDQRIDISCGAGSVGGVFFVMAAAVGTIVNRHVPEVHFTPVTTAGGHESANRLNRGGMQAYAATADIAYVAHHGGDPDRPNIQPGRNIRTWFMTEPAPFMLVARADNPNVTNFYDIWTPGMRLGTSPAGMAARDLLQRMSATLGRSYSALNKHGMGHEQTMGALRDRNIDLVFSGSGTLTAPNSAYQDLANSVRLNMFDMPEHLRDSIVNELPYWGKFTLAPNWLPGFDRPTNVVAIRTAFHICATVPDEIVYKMTAAVFENLDELRRIAYAPFRPLGPTTAASGAVVPFHPGALRYFQENGFDILFLGSD